MSAPTKLRPSASSIPRLAFALFVLLMPASASAAPQSAPQPGQPATLRSTQTYRPITGKQRFIWFAKSTIGPQSLATGIFSASIGTSINAPREYGISWEGFGKRYGMRLTGISTENAMEVGLGALWGEDPRYLRVSDGSFGSRLKNTLKMTFLAPRPDGHLAPAYARFLAIPGSNFLSNTWRVQSESSVGDAAVRTLLGFLGRMGSNAFVEFWPDVRKRVF
jgi:hypothetical protein